MNSERFWQEVLSVLRLGSECVLISVVEHSGSVPGITGAKAVVTPDVLIGTVGGGVAEDRLVRGSRSSHPLEPSLQTFRHTPNEGGTYCSGKQTFAILPLSKIDIPTIEELIQALTENTECHLRLDSNGIHVMQGNSASEVEESSATDWQFDELVGVHDVLTIIGGGHISLALSRVIATLGMRIRVLDNRHNVATMADNCWAHEKRVVDYREIRRHIASGERSYVAIMTHGHGHDLEVLAALIDTDLRYLALLGSRAKVAKLTAVLRERGVSTDLIKRVKAPAGIPIHSHTPAEIAISIAAEIVKLRDSSSS